MAEENQETPYVNEDGDTVLSVDEEGNEILEVIEWTPPDSDRKADIELVERRADEIRANVVDESTRTVSISLSSELPVGRSFGNEILVHEEGAIDMEFIGSGRAPLLMDHDHSRQIGVIESVELSDDKRLRAKVRFGRGAAAEEVFRDVVDGIRSNISVGYRVDKMERAGADDYRVTRWSPLEASVVSVPADMTVGVGRSQQAAEPEPTEEPQSRMEDIKVSDEPNLEEVRAEAAKEAAKAARASASEISALGAKHNKRDLADKALKDGLSVDQFRGVLLDAMSDEEVIAAADDQNVGLNEEEKRSYSVMRAIRAMANPTDYRAQEEAAFEREVSDAAAQKDGITARGFIVPTDVLGSWSQRDLNTSDDNELVATDLLAGSFIDVLRNRMSVMQAGATMIPGLVGNVDIPTKATASTAGWIATEGGAAAETEPTFGTVSLSPNQLGAFTDMTRQMIQQSTPAIEGIVRDDLAQAIALALDVAALEGSGASGQPTGILNTAGINTVANFAAAVPTFAEMVSFETALAEDNALFGNLAYITDATTYGGLKTQTKDAGSGQFVLENGTAVGYPVINSQQATAGNVYFGNWSECLIGMWGGLDLLVDPYTASNTGTVRIVAFQTADVAVRHAVSFALGNDGV